MFKPNPNDPVQKMKTKFRSSVEWKKFCKQVKEEQGKKCFVTGSRLTRTANVHHLDLNADHYTKLDRKNFVALSVTAHEVVHWLWRSKVGWREVMGKLKEILIKMEEINGTNKDLSSMPPTVGNEEFRREDWENP